MRSRNVLFALPLLAACAAAPGSSGTVVTGPAPSEPAIIGTSTGTMVRVSGDNTALAYSVSAPVERIWTALPMVYDALGIPVAHSDPATRQMGNRRIIGTRVGGEPMDTYVRCANQGAGPSAMARHRVTLSVITALQPEANGKTTMATQVSGTATPIEGTSSGAILCVSTGRLEARIHDGIIRRVPTEPAPPSGR